MSLAPRRVARTILVLASALAGGCREGSGTGQGAFDTVPIPLPIEGGNGCTGVDQPFAAGTPPTPVPLARLAIGTTSQLAAARSGDLLYATGDGATVVELDFGAGSPPAERTVLSAGVVDGMLAAVGIATPAVLSGIAVLDAANLVVVEQTSNTLLRVRRDVLDTVSFFAGLPSEIPDFADGLASLGRFDFSEPAQLLPSGDGRIFVADPGNHAVRVVAQGFLATVAGTGRPASADGSLEVAGFDTPVGLSVTCAGELLVSERVGSRLRSIALGPTDIFGNAIGTVSTLAGDGTSQTVGGTGTMASLAGPASPVTSGGGEVYWIDAASGVLRRSDLDTGLVDCPLFADCAAAVGAPSFTPGGVHSLAVLSDGTLYALDAAAGALLRVTP
jgi:hypothetical protein